MVEGDRHYALFPTHLKRVVVILVRMIESSGAFDMELVAEIHGLQTHYTVGSHMACAIGYSSSEAGSWALPFGWYCKWD